MRSTKSIGTPWIGALELGGITPKPQPGNPQPRMFRLLEDDALINRMGFNNIGMNKALSHLRKNAYQVPVGINVGVNKMTPYEARYQDYIKVIDTFKHDVSFSQSISVLQILKTFKISMIKMNFQCYVKL